MLIHKDLLSIGEVALVTGVAVHTLRYWENEFEQFFSPRRTRGGQRRYTDAEVKKILHIKKLLKEDKYSIAGAKQALSTGGRSSSTNARGQRNGRSERIGLVEASPPKLLSLAMVNSAPWL